MSTKQWRCPPSNGDDVYGDNDDGPMMCIVMIIIMSMVVKMVPSCPFRIANESRAFIYRALYNRYFLERAFI